MSKVQIQIVTWNSKRFINDCLKSVFNQSFEDFSVLVIDNNSTDGTVEYIREKYPQVSVLKNFKDVGFAKAHNQGFQFGDSEFYLVMNPDLVLHEDYLGTLIALADRTSKGASFGGKIYKLFSTGQVINEETGEFATDKSNIIDSTGILAHRNRWFNDRGEFEDDKGQYDKIEEVFGLTGACVLYRKEALQDTKVRNDFYDSNFFMYKEDIDLAWRFRLYGWTNWYQPHAISYHYRGVASAMKEGEKASQIKAARNKVPKRLLKYSFINHHLMLIKNDQFKNTLKDFFHIAIREIKLLGYITLFEPFQWKSIGQIIRSLPKYLSIRKAVKANTKINPTEIHQWFI